MKKSLLTFGAAAGFAAFAHGQGTIDINGLGGSAGFNTASSSQFSSSGWYSGNVTMEVFTIAAAGNATLANQINADETSLSSVVTGINLIESDFTSQEVSTAVGGSTLGSSTPLNIFDGGINANGVVDVGTASTLPTTTAVYYALVFDTTSGGLEGAVILDGGTAANGVIPSSTPYDLNDGYPSTDQNILLTATPEPTTLALAGLGGLSMLFLRRRKA